MFDQEKLSTFITQYSKITRFWVAYSGGLDSQVLLHSLSKLLPTFRLKAIHVNHCWHTDAVLWAQTSERTCNELGIHCEVITINAQPKKGESPEAYARELRYRAMSKFIQKEECLLTAHHRNDQIETLLLQLLRGAGLRGLASIPFCSSFGKGILARPLLDYTRSELEDYAKENNLVWIEDSSNTNLRFNRNFVRHQVIPLVKKRWPKLVKTLARVVENAAEAHQLLEELAYEDWLKIKDVVSDNMFVSGLLRLSPARRRNCLRYRFNQLHIPLPSRKQLEQIDLLLKSRIDANPRVNWGGFQARRHKNLLYIFKITQEKENSAISWDLNQSLTLPTGKILTVNLVIGQGIAYYKLKKGLVTVKFRQGGERFHMQNRCGSHPLKKLFQEWGVPPWQRQYIPLIYYENELIAVVGFGINPNYLTLSNEWGYLLDLKNETT